MILKRFLFYLLIFFPIHLQTQEICAKNIEEARKIFSNAWKLEEQKNFFEALKSYRQAFLFFKRQKNYSYTIAILNNMGDIYAKMRRYKIAMSFFEDALTLAKSKRNFSQCALLHSKLAMVCQHIGTNNLKNNLTKWKSIHPDSKEKPLKKKESTRKIQWIIQKDILPEDLALSPKITFIEEKTETLYILKENRELFPGTYQIQIRMPGYYPHFSRQCILPHNSVFHFTVKLKSKPRRFIPIIIPESSNGKVIRPHIKINGKEIGENFWVKPGIHEVAVTLSGYQTIKESVKILASEHYFLYTAEMKNSKNK